MSRSNIADEDERTEVGDDGIELGEPDPSRDSFVRGPRWGCLGGEPRLDVIWRKSTAGGEWARRVGERDSGDDAMIRGW